MKAWLVLTPTAMLLLAIVAAAFAWDSVRAERRRAADLSEVDADLVRQEARLVAALDRLAEVPPAVAEARANYQAASDRDARQARYLGLAQAVERFLLPTLEGDRPGDRQVVDELAGALHRRRLVARQWDELVAQYRAWQQTIPARVAARLGASSGTLPPAAVPAGASSSEGARARQPS